MDRRQFIQGAIALAALGWGEAHASPSRSAERVATAYRDALRTGRFLLVLVVPEDPTWVARYDREQIFGSWLTFADEDMRARLGSATLVAASMAQLVEIVPQAQGLGEPLFVLVDPHVFPARVSALDVELEKMPDSERGMDWEQLRKREGDVVDRRVAAVSALVSQALPTSPRGWDGAAPGGSSFWIASGCGSWPEDGEHAGYRCGMGHVPAKSARFLRFYATEEEAG